MPTHREVIRDDEDLLTVAVQQVAAALGPVVAELAAARARFVVAEEIERRDLVARESETDQPAAHEVVSAILERLERHATRPGATAVGAHDLVRRVARSMGVYGAGSAPALRRTRAEVDRDPNPLRAREGTQGLVGGVHRDEVSEKW